MAETDEHGVKYLNAYIVTSDKLTAQDISEFLLNKIPEYMIPSHFTRVEMMPKNSSGKIDRKSLSKIPGEILDDRHFEEPVMKLKNYSAPSGKLFWAGNI